MQLYIGNKNYSSWSMRAWLLMKEAGIAFEERRLRLDGADGSPFKTTLLALAPTGRVPLLVDDGFAVWDSLAIGEYLAEHFAERRLWPADPKQRARARCICAEMHSGFGELRNALPMNIEAVLADVGARICAEQAGVRRDLTRIDALWSEALAGSGGPFLFGSFSIADAFYAPVCSRVQTYGVPLSGAASAYVRHILARPSALQWAAEARAEHDFVAEDEPYRSSR